MRFSLKYHPQFDPRAASLLAASKNRSCQSVGLEEFEFASPIKAFVKNGHDKKKAAKKDLKFKNKTEQKARMQLEVTPPNN